MTDRYMGLYVLCLMFPAPSLFELSVFFLPSLYQSEVWSFVRLERTTDGHLSSIKSLTCLPFCEASSTASRFWTLS